MAQRVRQDPACEKYAHSRLQSLFKKGDGIKIFFVDFSPLLIVHPREHELLRIDGEGWGEESPKDVL